MRFKTMMFGISIFYMIGIFPLVLYSAAVISNNLNITYLDLPIIISILHVIVCLFIFTNIKSEKPLEKQIKDSLEDLKKGRYRRVA